MIPNKTFCVYPWIHQATLTDGSVIPCCIASGQSDTNLNTSTLKEAWNSPGIRDIRVKMTAADPVSACYQCYEAEAAGVDSHRTQSNRFYLSEYKDRVMDSIKNTTESGENFSAPFTLDIRAGNTCNLKCVMCRPQESSKWAVDSKELANILVSTNLKHDWQIKSEVNHMNFDWATNLEFWTEIGELSAGITELIFGGGEPFLIKPIIKLIDQLIDTGVSNNIKIRFHTNGTMIPEDFYDKIARFREVEIMFSIDGFGQKNQYMRYPTEWAVVEKNLRLCDETNARTMILASLHAMSIGAITELYEWRLSQPFKRLNKTPIILGRVHYPSYLDMRCLPDSMKNKITEQIQSMITKYKTIYPVHYFDELQSNVNYMNTASMDRIDEILEYMTGLDTIRKTDYRPLFPEFGSYVK